MNDLISRQAAIDSIMEEPSEARYPAYYAEKIKQLPSAQPEPTLEQIEEYCHKRCLSIVDNALLNKYAQESQDISQRE